MTGFLIKVLSTALIIIVISAMSRSYSFKRATLFSLPLITFLAFIWIYLGNDFSQQLIGLSNEIFWLVLPTLIMILLLPVLLKQAWSSKRKMLLIYISMIIIYILIFWWLGLFR